MVTSQHHPLTLDHHLDPTSKFKTVIHHLPTLIVMMIWFNKEISSQETTVTPDMKEKFQSISKQTKTIFSWDQLSKISQQKEKLLKVNQQVFSLWTKDKLKLLDQRFLKLKKELKVKNWENILTTTGLKHGDIMTLTKEELFQLDTHQWWSDSLLTTTLLCSD